MTDLEPRNARITTAPVDYIDRRNLFPGVISGVFSSVGLFNLA